MKKVVSVLLLICLSLGAVAQVNLVELKAEAAKGVADRQVYLASCYENGFNGVTKNMEESLKWYIEAAFRKNYEAIARIGYFYEQGYAGLDKNLNLAFNYYSLAASENNPLALLYLAKLYQDGRGCEKNLEEAIKFFYLSQIGFKSAKECEKELGLDSTKTPATNFEAIMHYATSANSDSRAMYALYDNYLIGKEVEKSKEKSIEWLKKAAEKGLTIAEYKLGMYYSSIGNYEEALKWFTKSGLKGDQNSIRESASLYLSNYPGLSTSEQTVMLLLCWAGQFSELRSNFSKARYLSDSDLLATQQKYYNVLNGVKQEASSVGQMSVPPGQASGQIGTGANIGIEYNQNIKNQRVPVRVLCKACNGSGIECVLKTVPTYGTTGISKRCEYCSQILQHGTIHVQRKCTVCQGKGYLER